VKPVQDPASGELAALHSLAEFASVVTDHGDSLVGTHAACAEELVQSRGRRWHLLMHVCVQAGSAIGKCCAPGNDVDVPLLYQFLRPGRFQLRQVARGFAALGAAADVDINILCQLISVKAESPYNCCARNPMVSNDYSMATSYGMSDHRRFRSPTFQ
jgi:hypothetical protein